MVPPPNRRAVLTCLGVAAGSLAGCLGNNSPTPQEPDGCPTSQDLSVRWPDELTEDSVGSFVQTYEEAYIQEGRGTTLHSVSATSTVETIESHEAGYVVEVVSDVSIMEPYLVVSASPASQSDAERVHAVDDIDDPEVRAFVEAGVEEEQYVETSSSADINRHVEALES